MATGTAQEVADWAVCSLCRLPEASRCNRVRLADAGRDAWPLEALPAWEDLRGQEPLLPWPSGFPNELLVACCGWLGPPIVLTGNGVVTAAEVGRSSWNAEGELPLMHRTCRVLEAGGELCEPCVWLGEPIAEMGLAIFAGGSRYTCPSMPLMTGAGDTIRGLV
eukprot:CAMPEP_0172935092 /NCGR_PEP_ID=MMETSP1075-20121228/221343_1 /TAXON_ID=2916 /ORGANISM="Ceratium fusus, Strain PA161109" /LENGTH=163 /DNA_ID=CAMNT_0013796451 /DNA_START=362 /DNA_END=850 /DNA_ORIENTATION=-